jgi:hypothetical protein
MSSRLLGSSAKKANALMALKDPTVVKRICEAMGRCST